ncbi:MAG: tail fiber domain-containing protein [Pyrinomonadaceae bacterium]|nr:tail fiber domain-containing protein [Blastocatellia bacterium]MCW5956806.1 tail fiber domain-containing protein [Pyrinomonadaceae bacterium]
MRNFRRLTAVTYRWETTGTAAIGLIAQEVFKVEPKLTSRDENNEAQSVKYDSVTLVLVNAVKEQQAQIETLVSRLKTVESELSALKKRKSVKPTALRMKSSIRRR